MNDKLNIVNKKLSDFSIYNNGTWQFEKQIIATYSPELGMGSSVFHARARRANNHRAITDLARPWFPGNQLTGQSISSIGRVPIEILPGKRHIT